MTAGLAFFLLWRQAPGKEPGQPQPEDKQAENSTRTPHNSGRPKMVRFLPGAETGPHQGFGI
eukprot:11226628-Lingulodinium_polyedra.AAC.1